MLAVKDPAIKLFGQTIMLPHDEGDTDSASTATGNLSLATTTSCEDNQKSSGGELAETTQEDFSTNLVSEVLTDPATSSGMSEDPKETIVEKETSPERSDKKHDPTDKGTSEEITLKKPDKILPCPRCNSMNTKFCYYNNYNVNQPRHFCKNCQRYWTSGGTMRSVPVGSGRRKNKSSSKSYYRHIMVSEALQITRGDSLKGIHPSTLKPNGTMLTFGSDALLCESMASALKIADKSQKFVRNGFHMPEQRLHVSCGRRTNGEDHLRGTSSTASNSTEKGGNAVVQGSDLQNCQMFPSQLPCFHTPPSPCFWNSGQWKPSMPPPAYNTCFPMPFYSVQPQWGCTESFPWNIPWVATSPASSDHSVISSSPNSPTLGKRSRDVNMLNSANSAKEDKSKKEDLEQHVLIPKTLRTDNPNEAAKSSIWSTLGIKDDNIHLAKRGSVFKAYQSKGEVKNHTVKTSLVLQANPAALSRSLSFREST